MLYILLQMQRKSSQNVKKRCMRYE